jgi:tRNA-modifying protein YgfZ
MTAGTYLAHRGAVQVAGPDAATLLNGLLTNDVSRAMPNTAVFAAMLTPQGKYLFDMFVLQIEADTFLLDVSRPSEFAKRLAMYKLRSKVTIDDRSSELSVVAGLDAPRGGLSFPDPRLAELGWRTFAASVGEGDSREELAFRHALGVPDPSVDLLVEKDFIMEGLFDELGGLDHHKGCYVGQEMTSRMKRRTSVKNKLCRVRYEGAPPAFETPILADNWEVGRMRSGSDGVGIAMTRFDRARKAIADGHPMLADGVAITLDPPDWLIQPEG